jgi:DNA repair protein RadC
VAELLSIVLGTGSAGCPVHELALRMIDAFPTLGAFVKADWLEMKARFAEYNERNPARPIKGLADAKLMKVAAAFQLARRANPLEDYAFRSYNLRSSSAAYEVFRRIVESAPEKEHFFVLPMDSDFHALCEPLDVSQGSVSRAPVHPRDVFCEAVRYRAYAILVAHNHPTGDLEPSTEDIEITERLIETGRLLGIKVLDHLILGSPDCEDGQGFLSIIEGLA